MELGFNHYMSNVSKSQGSRLAALRKDRGLTQGQLASRVGLKQPQISHLEKDERGYGDTVVAIAAALNTSADYLMMLTNDDSRPQNNNDNAHSVESNVASAPALAKPRTIPVVGNIKGGDDGYLEELDYPVGDGEGYVQFWTNDQSAYALRVRGESMHPRYRHGEFAVRQLN